MHWPHVSTAPRTNSSRAPYEGKAKRVERRGDGKVALYFKDDATAFNGQKHAIFPGKGALNSQITELLFHVLERAGIATHFLSRVDERTLLVREADMFAIEAVVRFKVAGSLAKRTGLPSGFPCNPAVVELYYKRDDLGDPMINDAHVALLGLATEEQLATIRALALQVANHLRDIFERANMDLVDLKFEFGKTPDGILLCDEVTPDTCRLHDKSTGTVLDKDRFRKDLGDLLEGYREVHRRLQETLGGSHAV